MSTLIHIGEADVVNDDFIAVPFIVKSEGRDEIHGVTKLSQLANRVYVTTTISDVPLRSWKLDPNDLRNDFAVVAAEAKTIRPFVMPVTTTNEERIASIMQSYVAGGCEGWC